MINFIQGNILTEPTDVLVVPTNTLGVAGAGLALAVRRLYPDWNKHYVAACRSAVTNDRPLTGGDLIWFETGNDGLPLIVSFMTKEDWRYNSRLDWIDKGLNILVTSVNNLTNVDIVSLPLLGCGNGNLTNNDVKELMISKLSDSPKLFRIYEYVA